MVVLRGLLDQLGWDEEFVMPSGDIDRRAIQFYVIAKTNSEKLNSQDFKASLEAVVNTETGKIKDADLSQTQRRIARKIWNEWHKETCLPIKFVQDDEALKAKTSHVWSDAKATGDFSKYATNLKQMI